MMNKHFPLVPVFCISMIFILLPCFPAGSRSLDVVVSNTFEYKHVSKTVLKQQSDKIYDSLQLENYGLHPEAFEYAYRGHRYLADKGLLENPGVITVCDFSQSSAQKDYM
ncbi:MAG: hypothetical protein HC867_09855 [Bacteroidia bacterium]|nr:hypothetical protein [Bacteroidia bacterium]